MAKPNNGAIKIEKGVQMPQRAKYPLAEMKIGDSFVIPAGNKTNPHQLAFHHRMKVETRVQPDGSRRVWRIA